MKRKTETGRNWMFHVPIGNYMSACTINISNGPAFTRAFVRNSYRKHQINVVSNSFDGAAVHSTAYAHDLLSRRTNIVMTAQTVTNMLSCSYNARNEVTGVTIDTNAYNYIYDNIGNSLLTSLNTVTNAYTVNNLNQYTAITDPVNPVNPVYDLDGNMVTNGVWSFTYDAENRMIAVYSNDTLFASNTYDHQSRRIRKAVSSSDHSFIWDGWNLIHETIASTNGTSDSIEYVWGLDLSGTMQGAGGVGGLLFEKRNGVIYIPCYDANGNVISYVDEAGAIRAYRVYDAFGNTVSKGGDMVDVFHFWFSTKYLDHETGLYYYGMRYFSPELGRWINRDPIQEDGGLNLYGCLENDPVNKYDVFGMFSLPNHWTAKVYSRLLNVMPPYMLSSFVASLVLRVNSWGGDDPWINRFLDNYFTGQKTRLTLSAAEVKQLKLTDDFNFVRIPGFFEQTIVTEAKYPDLLTISGKGPGNKTLGNFSARYKGQVCNDRFDGYFKIDDTFDFDWQYFIGGRSVVGELTVMYFTLVTMGSEFDVDSEWIRISQKHQDGYAKWR